MQISIVFKNIGFNINIGRKSVNHSQIYLLSIDKMYFKNGEVDFAKQLINF